MSAERFYSLLEKTLKAKTFEELKKPVIINATELNEGRNVYFNSGTLLDKLIASTSIPIVLNPAEIEGKQYVDGGIFCNMPAKIIRPHCEKLVGVHVNPIIKNGYADSILEVAERVYHLTIQSNTVEEKQVCDLVIEPRDAKNFGMFEISKSMEIFEIGYATANKAFDKKPNF
jgi:NTE family protein